MANLAPQFVLPLPMLALQAGQASEFCVNIGFLDHHRIARGDGFDFGAGEGSAINVLDAAQITLSGHHLGDELRLGFQGLPRVGIEGLFRHVAVNLNLRVRVSLAQNPALALLHVRRPPRRIQMMQRDETFLNVGARAHLLRAAEKNPHPPGAHVTAQAVFGRVVVEVLDERHLGCRNAARQPLVPDVFIDRKALAARGRRKVAKDKLCTPIFALPLTCIR